MILSRFRIVRDAYYLALKVEDKISKKTTNGRGNSVTQSQKFAATRGQIGGSKKVESWEEIQEEASTRNSAPDY